MENRLSRSQCFVGLSPNVWRCMAEKEDPTEGPIFNYRLMNWHLLADSGNTGNVEVIIQDSVDGLTWTNRYVAPAPITPGGMLDISVSTLGKRSRILVFSTGVGRVDATYLSPEEQQTALWPDVSTLACSSYCEISQETA